MAIGYIAKEPFTYVLEAEREKALELQSKFHLRSLSSQEDDMVMSLQMAQNAGWANTALRFGLLGWENFKDRAGKALPFKAVDKVPTDETLDLVKEIRFELGRAIRDRGKMTEEEEKN